MPPPDHDPMPLAYGLTEPVDLPLTRLPQSLDRLRIAHLTDLHLTRRNKRLDKLIYQLTKVRLDLGLLGGDYSIRQYPIDAAYDYLRELTSAVKPALGWFGVFGNHDRPDHIEQLQDLPVTWLSDEAIAIEQRPVEIIGFRCNAKRTSPDPLALTRCVSALPTDTAEHDRRLRIVLSHRPDFLPVASDLGADLMLAGHTHGGQLRVPPGLALINSSDLPLSMSAGGLRHRETVGVVSRGLGSTDLLNTPLRPRLFCPPHAPIVTLRRNTTQGQASDEITRLWRW